MGFITIFIEDDNIDCLRILAEFEKRGLLLSSTSTSSTPTIDEENAAYDHIFQNGDDGRGGSGVDVAPSSGGAGDGINIINVSCFPYKRNDMLSISDEYTPPQVYLNDTYIGGYKNTVHMLRQWDTNNTTTTSTTDPTNMTTSSLHEMFQRMVVNAPQPQDMRLYLNNNNTKEEEVGSSRNSRNSRRHDQDQCKKKSLFLIDDWISELILDPSKYDKENAIIPLPTPITIVRHLLGMEEATDGTGGTGGGSHENNNNNKGGGLAGGGGTTPSVHTKSTMKSSSSNRSILKHAHDDDDDPTIEEMVSIVQMTKLLQSILTRKDLSYNMTTYKKSFKGKHCIDVLSKHFNISRIQAEGFARCLQYEYQVLDHVVTSDHCIEDTDSLYFRLTCDQTPNILNSYVRKKWKWIDSNNNVHNNDNMKQKQDQQQQPKQRLLSYQLCDSISINSDLTSSINGEDNLSSMFSAAAAAAAAAGKDGKVGTSGTAAGPLSAPPPTPVNPPQPVVVVESPDEIMFKLYKMLQRIMSDNTTSSSVTGEKVVDYKKCTFHPLYSIFEDLICQLQIQEYYDIGRMSQNVDNKMSFCINLYNIMVRYAFIKVGIVNNMKTEITKRQQFFSQIMIQVGDDKLSLDDIEHGILRNNRKTPNLLVTSSQFSNTTTHKQDTTTTTRMMIGGGSGHGGNANGGGNAGATTSSNTNRTSLLILPKIDHRIHFALNCGTKSCPTLRFFHGHAIHEELRVCGKDFCNDDRNVFVDQVANELHLSQIFQWYKDDFVNPVSHRLHGGGGGLLGGSPKATTQLELPQVVLMYLKGKKKSLLNHMILGVRDGDRPPIKIQYIPYDWSHNAKDFIPFVASNLKADVSRIMGK